MKKHKAIDIFWALSLIIIGIATIILSITSVVGYTNRTLTITLGIFELIAVFVLMFTSVRKIIENKRQQN